MKRNHKAAGTVLVLLAVLIAFAGILAGSLRGRNNTVVLGGLPDPMTVVQTFFDSVCDENYSEAAACLTGASALGVENAPEDEAARVLWDTVRGNASWETLSNCECTGTEAEVTAAFHVPDAELLLEQAVSAAEADAEGESESSELFLAKLRECCEGAELPMRTTEITVQLSFRSGRWVIVADSELLACIGGIE